MNTMESGILLEVSDLYVRATTFESKDDSLNITHIVDILPHQRANAAAILEEKLGSQAKSSTPVLALFYNEQMLVRAAGPGSPEKATDAGRQNLIRNVFDLNPEDALSVILDAKSGNPVAVNSAQTVVCAATKELIKQARDEIEKWGNKDAIILSGTLAGVGALSAYIKKQGLNGLALYIEPGMEQSLLLAVSAEGVCAINTAGIGFHSLIVGIQQALNLKFAGSAAKLFHEGIYDFTEVAGTLITSLVESYKTALGTLSKDAGQSIEYLYCGQLTSSKTWVNEALANALGLKLIVLENDKLLAEYKLALASDELLTALPVASLAMIHTLGANRTPARKSWYPLFLSPNAESALPPLPEIKVEAPTTAKPQPPAPEEPKSTTAVTVVAAAAAAIPSQSTPAPAPTTSAPVVPVLPAPVVQQAPAAVPPAPIPPPQRPGSPNRPQDNKSRVNLPVPNRPAPAPAAKNPIPTPKAPVPIARPAQKFASAPPKQPQPPQPQPLKIASSPASNQAKPQPPQQQPQPAKVTPAQPVTAKAQPAAPATKETAPIAPAKTAKQTSPEPLKNKPTPTKPAENEEEKKKSPILLYAIILIILLLLIGAVVFLMNGKKETPVVSEVQAVPATSESNTVVSANDDAAQLAEAQRQADDQANRKAEAEAAAKFAAENARQAAINAANARGGIKLVTSPAGVDVLIDGVNRGVTPLSLTDLTVATHKVTLSKNGFTPQEFKAEIKSGEILSPKVIAMQSILGAAAIVTNPPGIKFNIKSLDNPADSPKIDESRRVTPIEIIDLKPGRYEIVFKRPNWPDYKEIVAVKGKEKARVEYVYNGGALEITSNPEGALIRSGIKELGITPLSLKNLDPGSMPIDIELDGFEPEARLADIIPGDTEKIKVTMLSLDRIVPAAQVTELPVRIEGVGLEPVHPFPKGSGKTDTVMIRCIIGKDGVPSEFSVQSSTNPECVSAALAAIQTWRFEPAKRKTYPVKTVVDIPFNFKDDALPAPVPMGIELPVEAPVAPPPQ